MGSVVDQLKFDSDGLIPAIIQDAANGEVLMMAFMNRDAVEKTLQTGITHFFSRSRQKIWQKGESSGHVQEVREIFYDCDADCLLVKAEQKVAACHTGHRSCFYRALGEHGERREAIFDPKDVYGDSADREILDRLYGIIADRIKNPRHDSYTNMLLAGGAERVGKKLLEESLELTIAARDGRRDDVMHEAADLLYHTWVILGSTGVRPDDVMEELAARFGKSGLEEKMQREES